jgi:hypothetical protein
MASRREKSFDPYGTKASLFVKHQYANKTTFKGDYEAALASMSVADVNEVVIKARCTTSRPVHITLPTNETIMTTQVGIASLT